MRAPLTLDMLNFNLEWTENRSLLFSFEVNKRRANEYFLQHGDFLWNDLKIPDEHFFFLSNRPFKTFFFFQPELILRKIFFSKKWT